MASRITKDLANKTLLGIKNQLGDREAFRAVAAKFSSQTVEQTGRKRRLITLDLNDEDDTSFWQVMQNSPDRFLIVSEKFSHQRGEFLNIVVFFELGDDLPLIKKKIEFLTEYLPNESL